MVCPRVRGSEGGSGEWEPHLGIGLSHGPLQGTLGMASRSTCDRVRFLRWGVLRARRCPEPAKIVSCLIEEFAFCELLRKISVNTYVD